MDQTLDRPLTQRERAAVIARIQSLMEFWDIRYEELMGPLPVAEPSEHQPAVPTIKYRHPVTGETWDGNGPHPDWLRRALLKEGMRVDELRPTPEALPQPQR